MTKLYAYLLALLSAIGGGIALYAKGRHTGKKVEEAKALEKDLAAEQKKSETLETVAEVRSEVNALPSSDAELRLRDKYTRD